MKHAKSFSILTITALLIYALVGFYFLPLAGFEGGLTRMGKLPESQFGWRKPQPAIAPELLRQTDWPDADVLVIGDSYSVGDPLLSNTKGYLWQSVLVQHGLKVHTEGWSNIQAICEDFSPWLKSKGFNGRYVILENVERGAEGNLDKSLKCQRMLYRSKPYFTPSPPEITHDRRHNDYSGKLSVGIQTWINGFKYQYLSSQNNFAQWTLPNNVKIHRMPNGCELFSHPSCQDILFLTEDRVEDFDEKMFSKMSAIESRLGDFVPIWVVVPDKTTTYFNHNKKFWDNAEQRFRAPNLLKVFRNAIQNKTVDLYRGNDTHTSTEGFLLMGDAINKTIQ